MARKCIGDNSAVQCDAGENACGRKIPTNICWYDDIDFPSDRQGEYGFITGCGDKCPKGYHSIRDDLSSLTNCDGRDISRCYFSSRRACERDWNQDDNHLVQCCVGNIPERDCAPDTVGSKCNLATPSVRCKQVMNRVCRSGNVSGDNFDACKEWCDIRMAKGDDTFFTCNNFYKNFCKGDNLESEECRIFCKNNPDQCLVNLQEFCKDKVDDPEYDNICGCYYPQEVYTNFYNDLNQKLSIDGKSPLASGIILNEKQCFFPICASAEIQPRSGVICPSLNFTECIANTNIDNKGNIIGDVTVDNNINCGGLQPIRKTCVDDPSLCNDFERCDPEDGECKPGCATDEQCMRQGLDYCDNGVCKKEDEDPTDPDEDNPPLEPISIIDVILSYLQDPNNKIIVYSGLGIIIFIFILLLLRKK